MNTTTGRRERKRDITGGKWKGFPSVTKLLKRVTRGGRFIIFRITSIGYDRTSQKTMNHPIACDHKTPIVCLKVKNLDKKDLSTGV